MPGRLIDILLFDGVMLLDATGPAEVFATAARLKPDAYKLRMLSRHGGIVRDENGLGLDSHVWTRPGRTHTLLVPGGAGAQRLDRDHLRWIAVRAGQVERIASVCLGAFALAQAGILAGKTATTHWRHCVDLANAHPEIQVEADAIWTRDDPVWTSAGVSAGIDLALAMVEADHGRQLALEVARRLVVFLSRPGGQSQFSAALEAQSADRQGRFAALHIWVAEHLDRALTIPELAAQAGMSPRNFSRAYLAATGRTPAKMVAAQRLEAARRALEGGAPVQAAAARSGYGDEERMRRAFHAALGVSPAAYRARF